MTDILLELVSSGRITVKQETSAREIDGVWEELEKLVSSVGDFRAVKVGMSDALARRLQFRHQPWAAMEIEKTLAPGVTRYGIVWRVVNLNWPIPFVSTSVNMKEKVVLQALRDSLDLYAEFVRKDS